MLMALWTRSDAHLVRRVLSGRRNDFGVLVRRHLPAALAVARGNLANPSDVDDVVQESFLAAYQKLDTLRVPQKFAAWLLTIVRNTAVSWQRRQRDGVPLEEASLTGQLQQPQPAFDRLEMQQMLQQTLMAMDSDTRELLLLHYFAGRSLREIAQLHGITRMAAAKRLQRARESLGKEFLKLVPEAPSAGSVKKNARKITAAALAAGATWKAASAHGLAAALAIGAAKLAGVSAALSVVLAGAFLAAPAVLGWEPSFPETSAASAEAAAPAPAKAAETAPLQLPIETRAEEEVGHFSLSNVLVTPFDQPVGDARVVAERVTWRAGELPPATTEKWVAMADANGSFTFPDLPAGGYSVTAYTTLLGGAHDFLIEKEGKVHGPRNVKMYPIIRSYGVLLDAAGNPVPGAVLYPISHELFPEQEFDHVTVAGIRACTDNEGRFRFQGVIPGAWRLFVVAPGHVPFYTDYIPCYGLRSTVVIQAPGRLVGRVIDAAGQPLPEVKGSVFSGHPVSTYEDYQPDYRMQQEFISDASGVFRMDSVASGTYAFSIKDAALTLVNPALNVRVDPGTEARVELAVTQGATIAGRVLDGKSGEGVAGIDVSTYSRSAGISVSRKVVTGPDGHYLLTGLPAGAYEIRAQRPSLFLSAQSERLQATVSLGETLENQDIALEPTITLSGRVVDADGAPAAAEVTAAGSGQYMEGKSGVNGAFSLTLLPRGKVTMTAKTGTARSKPVEVSLEATEAPEVLLELGVAANGGIEGVVYDADGKTAYNVDVSARASDASPYQAGESTRTEAGGRFKLTGLPAGEYHVAAFRRSGEFASAQVTVQENVVSRDVQVRAKPAGNLAIEGTVYYPNGMRCPFAVLTLDGGQAATSGALGNFTFSGLNEGNYSVYALSPGYSPVVKSGVAAGTNNLEVTLRNFAALSGEVIDAATRQPVPNFSAEYMSRVNAAFDTGVLQSGERSFSDPQGKFRFDKVPVIPVTLQVKAVGYAPWTQPVEIAEGGQETSVSVELQGAAKLTGTVRNEAGEPVASATIRDKERQTELATTDAAGNFAIDELPAGKETRLSVFEDSYVAAEVAVTPGRAEHIDIVLSHGGSMRVRTLLDGQPVEEFSVMIETADSLNRSGHTSTGEVLVSGIQPGEVQVNVHLMNGQGSLHRKVKVIVAAGQETPLEVSLGQGTAAIDGAILTQGTPPAYARIALGRPDGAFSANMAANADGTFRIEHIPAGTYSLHCSTHWDSGEQAMRTFEITLQENETQRVMCEFAGSCSVEGVLQGVPAGAKGFVYVLDGAVPMPSEATPEALGALINQHLAHVAQAEDSGAISVRHLEPGTYTFLSMCLAQPDNPETLRFSAQVLELKAGETAALNLTLP